MQNAAPQCSNKSLCFSCIKIPNLYPTSKLGEDDIISTKASGGSLLFFLMQQH